MGYGTREESEEWKGNERYKSCGKKGKGRGSMKGEVDQGEEIRNGGCRKRKTEEKQKGLGEG